MTLVLSIRHYKIFWGFFNPPPQKFSGGDANVPRSSALKGLITGTTKHTAVEDEKLHQ